MPVQDNASLARLFTSGPQWVLGFMSGTSLDGVDAALIQTDGEKVLAFGDWSVTPFSASTRPVLAEAVTAARAWNFNGPPPNIFSAAAKALAETHHAAGVKLLASWHGPKPVLVGFHGQTVLHRAAKEGQAGRTCQIGDAHGLALALGLPVVHDFRSADVAAGGQGAPLAPIYHLALLQAAERRAVVLNMGGVANMTALSEDGLIAFDCGPANGPLDEWIEANGAGTYDENGRMAAAGRVHEVLLVDWLDRPFFAEPPPKSLDRFDFSASLVRGLNLHDGAATLTAFAAASVGAGLDLIEADADQIVVCGGGRHNPTFMEMLAERTGRQVLPAEALGWRGDAIEAEAFAFLAARSVRGLPLSFPGTTGVPEPVSGGQIVWP
jgi:anhydro-N-acetylmuramic acid kinase